MVTGLKVSMVKSFFGHSETGYIGFWTSKDMVRQLLSKVDTINDIDTPTKLHDTLLFVVSNNNYRYMWKERAYTISPLNKL